MGLKLAREWRFSPPSGFYMSCPPLMACTVFAAAAAAPAAVVNIDFSELATAADRYAGLAAATDPAGATAIWNNIVGSVGALSVENLMNSSGEATTWDIAVSGFVNTKKSASEQEVAQGGSSGGSYSQLMEDYLQLDSGANASVTIASGVIGGLAAGNTYDIYFYGQGSDMAGTDASSSGENSLFTVNASSRQTGWDGLDGGDGNLVEGMEYVQFTAVADAGGKISFTWSNVVQGVNVMSDQVPSNTGTGSRFAALNGMQIVDAVPEPSTAIFGMAASVLLLLRRRRAASSGHGDRASSDQ